MNCSCGYYFIRHICYNCGDVDESDPLKGVAVWIPPKRIRKPLPKYSPTTKKRKRIFERDGNKCLKCLFSPSDLPKGNRANWLTIDHVIPRSKGGGNSDDNLQTLCYICNCEKGNKNSKDYRQNKSPK